MSKNKKRNLILSGICLLLLLLTTTIGNLSGASVGASATTPLSSMDSSIYTSPSAFQFTAINSTECSVKLIDKTLTSIRVPKTAIINDVEYTVTEVATNGFSSALALKKIIFPITLKKVGNTAFQNCANLELVYLPRVQEIGISAFAMCLKLKDIIFPSTLQTVGNAAFMMSSTKVHARFDTVPNGWSAGWNSGNTVQLQNHDFNQRDEKNNLWMHDFIYEEVEQLSTFTTTTSTTTRLAPMQPFMELESRGHLEIPNTELDIANMAFMDGVFDSITILDGEEPINIWSSAFLNITVSEGFIIRREVTYNCSYLGAQSFAPFNNVDTPFFIIPAPTNILTWMFIYTTASNIHFRTATGVVFENTGVVRIPDGIEEIGELAFADANNITHLYIPSSVTTIQYGAFSGWNDSQNIHVPFANQAEMEIAWEANWDDFCSATIIYGDSEQVQTNTVTFNEGGYVQYYDILDNLLTGEIEYEQGTTLQFYAVPTEFYDQNTITLTNNGVQMTPSGIGLYTFTVDGDCTIAAQGQINQYTISYSLDGGTNHSSNPNSYYSNQSLTLNNASKTGYNFVCWKDDDGNTVTGIPQWSKGSKAFTAVWTPIQYTVTYDVNGGDALNPSSKPVTYDSHYTLAVPTRTGYTFDGWYYNATQYTNDDGTSIVPWTETLGKTLYAKWTPKQYTIYYNVNGGNPLNPSSKPVTYDSHYTLAVPTRTGYTFDGWYYNATQYTNDDGTSKGEWTMSSDETLYAEWTPNQYTIYYNVNGGNPLNPDNDDVTYDSHYTLAVPTRTGYAFDGWYYNATQYTNDNGTSVVTWTETLGRMLYAKWTPNQYTVTFDRQGGSGGADSDNVVFDNLISNITTPTRTGYIFKGYFTETSGGGILYYTDNGAGARNWGIADNTTLYAKWEAIQYKVTYHLYVGGAWQTAEDYYTIEGRYNSLMLANHAESFDGWYANQNLSGNKFYYLPAGSTGDRNYYGYAASLTNYTINFYLNGTLYSTVTYTMLNKVIVHDVFRSLCSFNGWYKNSSLTGAKVSELSLGSTGNINLYGNLSKIGGGSVTVGTATNPPVTII